MFEIGASLAAARKEQGLTLADAERRTCLRARYLTALELDLFEQLPGRVYARAFLRTYAEALGLDSPRYLAEFDDRYPLPAEVPEPPPRPRLRARPRLSRRLALGVVALAAVAAVIAWSNRTTPRLTAPPAPAEPAVHRLQPVVPQRLSGAVDHAMPAKRQFPLVISATSGDCWVQVRQGGATGRVLYEGILASGKSLSFAPRVWVRLGAPGHVSVHRGARVWQEPGASPVDLIA